MFQVPDLRVFIMTRSVSLIRAMRHLCQRGMRVISGIGGRRTAIALLKEGLVRDL
jgi:hypothetical protein